jgi:beta-lactamase regulating signal transducer with metallopeptidase domain
MTGIDALLHQPAAQAVGWALLHFVWQGTVIAIFTALALLALRRSAADVRYVVSAIGLALMLTLPVVTGVQTWKASTATAARTSDSASHTSNLEPRTSDRGPRISNLEPRTSNLGSRTSDLGSRPSDLAHRTSAPGPQPLADRGDVNTAAGTRVTTFGSRVEPLLPLLIGIWLAGVMFLSLRLLTGWLWIQRLRTYGATAAGESWQRMASRLSRRLHIARTITLLESTLVEVPTVIGFIKPVVLLPASALSGLSAGQLEAILAHELAHIRRHDYLVNLLQTLVETLLFYHPAVWWLSRRIRAEREHCCDDLAVSLCGDPIAYANALTDLEALRSNHHHFVMAATGGSLLHRVRRLIGAPTSHAGRAPAWLAGSAALILIGGIAVGADGLRQTAAPPSQSSPSTPAVAPAAPFSPEELTTVLEQAEAAVQSALRALRLEPFVGALPLPPEGTIAQRLGEAYEHALRAQEEVLRAQNEAWLAHEADEANAAHALQRKAFGAQADALASLSASTAPALASLSNMESASAALAGLGADTAPALAAIDSSMASASAVIAALGDRPVSVTLDGDAEMAAAAEQASKAEQHVSISHHQDDSSGNWIWSNNGEKLSVSYSGRFDFTDDDTDVREISSGGYLKISDAALIGRHTVEVHERGGTLERKYYVNGSERPFEPEGRQWLHDNLPKFVRNTGMGADRRVARLLKSGGPSAVLAEISRIDGSYVKRIYFTELLKQATLSAEQYRAVLNQAGRDVNSDYELATMLIEIADRMPTDETSRAAYFSAASSISSDYELRRVYSKMLDKGPVSPAILASILTNAKTIESDYELSELLQQILSRLSLDDQTRPLFFRNVSSIGGDYERHRVLSAAVRGTPDSATVLEALNCAADINGDYEAAQFLLEVLQKGSVEGAVRPPFFKVVNSLDGGYERGRVLQVVARKSDASHDTILAVLQSAKGLSGYELSQLLQAVASTHVLSGDLRDAYLDAADSLSGYEQGQVMTALVKSERRK